MTWKEQYYADLETDEWRDLKEEVFKHYGRNCMICGGKVGLEVHHRKYRRHEDGSPLHPYEYGVHELSVLCAEHHRMFHNETSGDMKVKIPAHTRNFLYGKIVEYSNRGYDAFDIYEKIRNWKNLSISKEQLYEYLKTRGYDFGIIDHTDDDVKQYIEDKRKKGINLDTIIKWISGFPYWTYTEAENKIYSLGYYDFPYCMCNECNKPRDVFQYLIDKCGWNKEIADTAIRERSIIDIADYEYDSIPWTQNNSDLLQYLREYDWDTRCKVFQCSRNILDSQISFLRNRKMLKKKLTNSHFPSMDIEQIKELRKKVEHGGVKPKPVYAEMSKWEWDISVFEDDEDGSIILDRAWKMSELNREDNNVFKSTGLDWFDEMPILYFLNNEDKYKDQKYLLPLQNRIRVIVESLVYWKEYSHIVCSFNQMVIQMVKKCSFEIELKELQKFISEYDYKLLEVEEISLPLWPKGERPYRLKPLEYKFLDNEIFPLLDNDLGDIPY